MAKRPTYEEVAYVCNELWEEGGKRPSVHAVRAMTKGSMSTVHEHWQRWCKDRELLAEVGHIDFPKELTDSILAQLVRAQKKGFATAKEKIAEMSEVEAGYRAQEKELEAELEDLSLSLQSDKVTADKNILELEKKISAEQATNLQVERSIQKLELDLLCTQESLVMSRQDFEKSKLICSRLEKELSEVKIRETGQNEHVSSLQKENIRLEKELSVAQENISNFQSQLKGVMPKFERLKVENSELRTKMSTSKLETKVDELQRQLFKGIKKN